MTKSKPVVVRSAANPRIRHLQRMRDNRARRKADRVLVDGWRETSLALQSGMTLCQLAVPESAADLEPLGTVALTSDQVLVVSESLMEKIGYGDSARGIVAEFQRPHRGLAELDLPASPLILVLDGVEKPGNVGAIFRCADAVGVDAVLLCESADRFNPNAIRNSLGSVFHVPAAVGTEAELATFLAQRQIRPVAARVESATPLWSADLHGPLAIILGSEARGLGDRWRCLPPCDGQPLPIAGVSIPLNGAVDSLNVAVSAAVILYEAIRRRSPPDQD